MPYFPGIFEKKKCAIAALQTACFIHKKDTISQSTIPIHCTYSSRVINEFTMIRVFSTCSARYVEFIVYRRQISIWFKLTASKRMNCGDRRWWFSTHAARSRKYFWSPADNIHLSISLFSSKITIYTFMFIHEFAFGCNEHIGSSIYSGFSAHMLL